MASNKNEPTKWRSEQLRDECARASGPNEGQRRRQEADPIRQHPVPFDHDCDFVVALLLTTTVLLQTGVMARAPLRCALRSQFQGCRDFLFLSVLVAAVRR